MLSRLTPQFETPSDSRVFNLINEWAKIIPYIWVNSEIQLAFPPRGSDISPAMSGKSILHWYFLLRAETYWHIFALPSSSRE